jgi:hypothetical protein
VDYEWDEAKATNNLAKHGVSFEEASSVFADPLYVDFYDPRAFGGLASISHYRNICGWSFAPCIV